MTLVALLPLVSLLALTLAVGVNEFETLLDHRRNLQTVEAIDAATELTRILAAEHIRVERETEQGLRLDGTAPIGFETSTMAMDRLIAALVSIEDRDAALVVQAHELADVLDMTHRRMQFGAVHGSLVMRQHREVRQFAMVVVRRLAPGGPSATIAWDHGVLVDILQAWSPFIDEGEALARHLAGPTPESRMAAQAAVQIFAGEVAAIFDLSAVDALVEFSTPTYQLVVAQVVSGTQLDRSIDPAEWVASQRTREDALAARASGAVARYRADLEARLGAAEQVFVAIAVLIVGFIAVVGMLVVRLRRSIGDRLSSLVERADGVVQGRFDMAGPTPAETGDEIASVHAAFEAVAAKVQAFGRETDRLSAALLAGDASARADERQHEGEWRHLIRGLNSVMERHQRIRDDLESEASRIGALEALARASLGGDTVPILVSTSTDLILAATGGRSLEFWEATNDRLHMRLSTADAGRSVVDMDAVPGGLDVDVLRGLVADRRSDAVSIDIDDDLGLSGILVVANAASEVSIAPILANIRALLSAAATRDSFQRRNEHNRLHDPRSGLPNGVALRMMLAERLSRRPIEHVVVARVALRSAVEGDDPDRSVAVSEVVRSSAPLHWDVADLGPCEFAMLLPDDDDDIDTQLAEFSADTRRRLGWLLGDRIGFVRSSDVEEPSEASLLLAASQSLQAAHPGGGVVRFSPTLGLDARKMNEVRLALLRDLADPSGPAFTVHFQPIVDFASSRVTAVEALARWTPADMGPQSPELFIRIAEAAGVVDRLDELIAQRAMMEMQAPAMQAIRLVLNASAVDLSRGQHAARIARLGRETGFSLDRLGIELTETAMVRAGDDLVLREMEDLRALGCDLAIDDFGSGHASFSYLTAFPVTKVKIDRTFITDIDRRVDARAVVDHMVSLAHELDLEVVAEGIEREEELRVLLAAGCDSGQGYLFSKPVPTEEIADATGAANRKVASLVARWAESVSGQLR